MLEGRSFYALLQRRNQWLNPRQHPTGRRVASLLSAAPFFEATHAHAHCMRRSSLTRCSRERRERERKEDEAMASVLLPTRTAVRLALAVIVCCASRHSCSGFGLLSASPPPAHVVGTMSLSSRGVALVPSSPPSAIQSNAVSWLEIEDSVVQSTAFSLPSQLLATAAANADSDSSTSQWTNQILHAKRFQRDKVKRVIDSSTVQLDRGGYVSLETVRGAGATYQLPDCFSYAPSYKLKALLPKGTDVRLINLDDAMGSDGQSASSAASSTPRVWIVRESDGVLINKELVRTGFAFVRKGARTPQDMMDDLLIMEQGAKDQRLGIYKTCDVDNGSLASSTEKKQDASFVAEFEPLDFTTTIEYGDDGGKSVIVSRKDVSPAAPPSNPGDVKGCSDFRNYEEVSTEHFSSFLFYLLTMPFYIDSDSHAHLMCHQALGWYEKYFEYYGDVAKLDRDGDGVPCPGLPHTTVAEKYRMKRPNNSLHNSK